MSPFIPTARNIYGAKGTAASLIPTFTFLRDFVELVPSGTFTFKGSHRVETVSSLTNTRDGLALVHICTRREDNQSRPATRNLMQGTSRGGTERNVSCRLQVARQRKHEKGRAWKRVGWNSKPELQSRFETFHSTLAVTRNVMQKKMLKDPGKP